MRIEVIRYWLRSGNPKLTECRATGAAKCDEEARKNPEIVANHMAPAQIAEAQHLAREWMAKEFVTLTGFTANFWQSAGGHPCGFNGLVTQGGAEIGLYLINVTMPTFVLSLGSVIVIRFPLLQTDNVTTPS